VKKLSSEKAQILKHLLIKDAKFRLIPIVYWTQDSTETKAYPLSIEDEKIVTELKKANNTTSTQRAVNAKGAAARRKSKKSKTADDVMEDVEEDEEDDEDEDEEFDDAQVGDKVTKSMMLPAGR
jgi:mRNA turnover protein 4